jgi:hypothetical protein
MRPEEPAVLVLDNAPTRGDLAALHFLAEKHIIVATLPPHLTHVMQPIDACWARSFKTAYRQFLKAYIREDALVRAYSLLGPTARTGARSKARDSRVSIAFAVVDTATMATVTFLTSHAFSATVLFPVDVRRPPGSKYVRACDDDVERQWEALKPDQLHTGSGVLTVPAFPQLLTSRLAPKEVAELERRNIALERLTGPREVGLYAPDAEVEDEEPAEIDLLEPDGQAFEKLLAEGERIDQSAPSDGEDCGFVKLSCWLCQARGLHDGVRCPISADLSHSLWTGNPPATFLRTSSRDLPIQSWPDASPSLLVLQPVPKLVFVGPLKIPSNICAPPQSLPTCPVKGTETRWIHRTAFCHWFPPTVRFLVSRLPSRSSGTFPQNLCPFARGGTRWPGLGFPGRRLSEGAF